MKHEMYINSTKHINNFNDTQAGTLLSMSRSFSGPIVLQNLGTDTLTVDMVRISSDFSIQCFVFISKCLPCDEFQNDTDILCIKGFF